MEEKIHEMKDWSDIKSHDSWEIFKIMSEFVEGFERLSRIGPCVSIFGSAKTELDNKYYKLAEELAFQLTQHKFGVITGGGPGIMEAANKGAMRGDGKSVGLNIELPFEQSHNEFIDNDKILNFDYFYVHHAGAKRRNILHFFNILFFLIFYYLFCSPNFTRILI